jgi:predicted DNA-binding transcriptional regulator YafY
MADSKLAFYRYMLIDSMIRSKQKPYPTKQELLDACLEKYGVTSLSTIEKDIFAMRTDLNAPIEFSKKEKGYYYKDKHFKLFAYNLSEENIVALSFVESFLEDFKMLPIFNEFSDAVDKVLDGIEITKSFNKDLRHISRFIQIDKSPYFKGKDTLSRLIKVIAEQQVVELTYKKFMSVEKKYVIHPYLIKEFKNLWYLTGYVPATNDVRTFGIDRIVSFGILDDTYIPKEEVNFSAETFFGNCYGITALNEKPEEIVLSFTSFLGNYIKTQPIHTSQQILIDTPEELRISLYLINNQELQARILEYGASVKVLAPETLKQKIKQELQRAVANY